MTNKLNKEASLSKKQVELVAIYATRAIEKLCEELSAGPLAQGEQPNPEVYYIFKKLDGYIVNINRLIDGETLETLLAEAEDKTDVK